MPDTTPPLAPRPPAAEPPRPKRTLVIVLAVGVVVALAMSFALAFPAGAPSAPPAPTAPEPAQDWIADNDPTRDCPTAGPAGH